MSFQDQTVKNCCHDHMSSTELFQFLFQTCLHLNEPELQSGCTCIKKSLESQLSTSSQLYASESYVII